jgi:hypothetical protein
MGSITDYAENELLDHCLNAAAYTPLATIYLGLATADPTDAATGAAMNECADSGSYARTAITFAAAASRQVLQTGAVTFPQATGAWGNVTHWAILDGNTHGAGNALAHGAFGTAKNIVSGNTPSVASGQIYVNFAAGEISDALSLLLLDFMFRDQAFGTPATYGALCTATINDSDTGATITEPSGNGYAREVVNPNAGASPKWTLASGGSVDNDANIDFGPASGGNWGTVVAVAVLNALTSGTLMFYDNAMTDQNVSDGDTARFPTGDLDVQMT